MRKINRIIMHCSKSSPSSAYGFDEIKRDHLAKGWTNIGYHFVIDGSGKIHIGRPLEIIGAHCYGHNSDSIGICIIGGNDWRFDFKPDQIQAAHMLVGSLRRIFNIQISDILGHNELDPLTKCPVYSMDAFRHIIEVCY